MARSATSGPQAHGAPRRCPTEGKNSTEGVADGPTAHQPAEASSQTKTIDLYARKKSTRLFTLRVRHCGVGATSQ